MKAEELMIGDWVMDIRSNTPLRVNPFLAQLEVLEWKPIPLTPEILEKNFPKADTVDWWPCGEDGYKFYIVVKGKEITIMGKMSDLHQLQHALKLCGIDKEIVI